MREAAELDDAGRITRLPRLLPSYFLAQNFSELKPAPGRNRKRPEN
jgi:hypothetical protein